jgi:hypothetical protein
MQRPIDHVPEPARRSIGVGVVAWAAVALLTAIMIAVVSGGAMGADRGSESLNATGEFVALAISARSAGDDADRTPVLHSVAAGEGERIVRLPDSAHRAPLTRPETLPPPHRGPPASLRARAEAR